MPQFLTKLWLSTSLLLMIIVLQAQDVPDSISYQAVVRDINGAELANQFVTVQFSVRHDSATGPIFFQEFHDLIETNQFGLFSTNIGGGVPTGNGLYTTLGEIPWNTGLFFLEVSATIPGSGDTQILGTSQLLTVPFAFYADKASVAETVLNEVDGDPTNEIITDFYVELPYLYIEEGDALYAVNVIELGLGVSQDNDATNELIVDVQVEEDSLLIITEGPNELTFNLAEISFATWHKNNISVYNTTERIGIGTANPTSTLHVDGSTSMAFETVVAGTYTMDNVSLNEHATVYICNVSSGDVFINLPQAATCAGRVYKFRKYNPTLTSNDVSILPYSGETIDANDDYTLSLALPEFLTIISTGVEWIVIDHSND
jgi:hypothetical protein